MQSFLARNPAGHGMNEGAGFDVDFAFRLGRVDFEDAGTAPETLDLNDVGEPDLLQRPGKAVAMSPGDQVIQNIEDKPHAIPGNGFFEKKLRTGGEALGPINTTKGLAIGPTLAWRPTKNARFDLSPLLGCSDHTAAVQVFAVFSFSFGGLSVADAEIPASARSH